MPIFAPLYQNSRNRYGQNNWDDCLASWYTANFNLCIPLIVLTPDLIFWYWQGQGGVSRMKGSDGLPLYTKTWTMALIGAEMWALRNTIVSESVNTALSFSTPGMRILKLTCYGKILTSKFFYLTFDQSNVVLNRLNRRALLLQHFTNRLVVVLY